MTRCNEIQSERRREILIHYHSHLSVLQEVHYHRNHHRSDVTVVRLYDKESGCRAQHLQAKSDNPSVRQRIVVEEVHKDISHRQLADHTVTGVPALSLFSQLI